MERTIEKKLVGEIKKRGGWSVKLLPFAVSGLPDRLNLLPGGRASFVELKRPKGRDLLTQKVVAKGRLSNTQLKVHKQLRKLGFFVWVVDGEESLQDYLKNGI